MCIVVYYERTLLPVHLCFKTGCVHVYFKIIGLIPTSCFERRSQRNFKSRLCRDFSFVLKYNSKLFARVSAVQWGFLSTSTPNPAIFE
jgi:hypothetical protein